ncbi:MAG: peptidylprolyl isomerase [Candidatus Obscuribacterales bacterium]|nr:peptidylprolyl isomerase [Candidatus Obscuribacterales bacterium]
MFKVGNLTKSALLAASILFVTGLAFLSAGAQNGTNQTVRLETTKGPITIRVYNTIVPYTAGNFLDLVDSGFYNGLIWHRVENWVIQGGDPNGNGTGNATDAQGNPKFLRLECNPNLNHNQAGMVAMARNQNPNSASCQFYILKSPMPQLNGKYAVFGRVIGGMQTVYAIRPGDRIVSAQILQSNNDAAAASSSSSDSSSSQDAPPVGRNGKPKDSGF